MNFTINQYIKERFSCLQDHDTEIYPTFNKGIFVLVVRFRKNLINKNYKYMISVS